MAEKEKEKDKKPDLGLLEEDDEFEEFPAEGDNLSKHEYMGNILVKNGVFRQRFFGENSHQRCC